MGDKEGLLDKVADIVGSIEFVGLVVGYLVGNFVGRLVGGGVGSNVLPSQLVPK